MKKVLFAALSLMFICAAATGCAVGVANGAGNGISAGAASDDDSGITFRSNDSTDGGTATSDDAGNDAGVTAGDASSDGGAAEDAGGNSDSGSACQADAECLGGQICSDGKCVLHCVGHDHPGKPGEPRECPPMKTLICHFPPVGSVPPGTVGSAQTICVDSPAVLVHGDYAGSCCEE